MSRQDYEALSGEIRSIRDEETLSPTMPVAVYLQESEDLFEWCRADRQALERVGLDWALVDGMPQRIGAARYAQSAWNTVRFTRREAQQQWDAQSPIGYDLRDELVHHFFYAFRRDARLVGRVRAIDDGSGGADLVQDLSDLATLGRKNAGLLEAVGIDPDLLDRAVALSGELADLLAVARGVRGESPEARLVRDKAFTYLKLAVSEIRQTGRYVFWRSPERVKGYASEYNRRLNRRRRREGDTGEGTG